MSGWMPHAMSNRATSLRKLLCRMNELPEFAEQELTDVNQVGNFGNRPLHVAAGWNDPNAVKLLVESGADVNGVGEEWMTPLHRAAAAGSLEAAAALLRLGARLDCTDSGGATPLKLARSLDRRQIVTLFDEWSC
jgi:ankyrin repeat protein